MNLLRRLFLKSPWLLLFLSAFAFFADLFLFKKWFFDAPSLYTAYPWKVDHFFPITEATGSDPDLLHWPAQHFLAEELFRKGRLPLWNPEILTGVLFLGGGQKVVFALTNLVHLLPDFLTAVHLKMMIQMALLGLTAYLFLKNLCRQRLAALLGAGAWMLGGYATTKLRHLHSLEGALWLPLVLLFVRRGIGERRPLFLSLAGGLMGILFLGSFQVVALHAAAISLLYLLFQGASLVRRPVLSGGLGDNGGEGMPSGPGLAKFLLVLVAGGGLFLAVSFPGTVPSFLELLQSTRMDPAQWSGFMEEAFRGDYLEATKSGLRSYRGFLVLAVSSPLFLRAYWANALFLGLTATSLAAVGVAAARREGGDTWRTARFFLFLGLFFLVLPALTYPLMWLSHPLEALRGFHSLWFSLSRPTRASLGLGLSVAVLSAFGARALLAEGSRAWRDLGRSIVAISLLLLIFVTALSLFGKTGEGARDGLPGFWERLSLLDWRLFLAVGLGLGLLLFLRRGGFLGSRGALLLVYLLLASELILAGRHLNRAYPRSLAFPPTPAVDFLKEAAAPSKERPPIRVLSLMPSLLLGWYANLFPSNSLMLYGVQELGGHEPSLPLAHLRFFSRLGRPEGSYNYRVQFHTSYLLRNRPLLDLLSVRYLLLPPGGYLALDGLELVYDREIRIYQNRRAFPRAFMVYRWVVEPSWERQLDRLFDGLEVKREVLLEKPPRIGPACEKCETCEGKEKITYGEYLPNRIRLRVELSCPGLLVMSDTYHRNWRAEVDGGRAELERANYLMRALPLSSGRHEVHLRYEDPWLKVGLFSSGVGLLVLVVLGLLAFRGKKRPRGDK